MGIQDSAFVLSQGGQHYLRQLAVVVGGRNDEAEVKGVVDLVEADTTAGRPDVRRSLLLGLGDGLRRSRSSLNSHLKNSPSSAALLGDFLSAAKRTLARSSSSASEREQAIEMLGHGRFHEVKGPLAAMLDTRESPTVQLAAVLNGKRHPTFFKFKGLDSTWLA